MTQHFYWGSLRVALYPDRPKMQLSADVAVPAEFRKEINAWMLSFFGTTNLLNDGALMRLADGSVVANPRTFAALYRFRRVLEL